MANVAVYVELRAGNPTAQTVYALTQAREIADALGATVYAVVPAPPIAATGLEQLATSLGEAGADRVIVCSDPALGGAPLHATHGRLLHVVALHVRPRLCLFPAGTVAAQLAAPFAAQERAIFFPKAAVSVLAHADQSATLHLTRLRGAWDGKRVLDVMAQPRLVVAVLCAGQAPPDRKPLGQAELEILSYPTSELPQIEELSSSPDDQDGFLSAPSLLVVPDDLPEPALQPLRDRALKLAPERSFAMVSATHAAANADVLAPARLLVIAEAGAAWPPAIGADPRGPAGLCAPRKPTRAEGLAAWWKTDSATAVRDLGAEPPLARPRARKTPRPP